MTQQQDIISTFHKQKLLCIGDVMLDRFVYGKIERISPEAPVPVFSVMGENAMLGGAGNVARNISSLGAKTSLVSVIGDDKTGDELIEMIGDETGIASHLVLEKQRITTTKTRYVAGSQQVMRADREVTNAITSTTENQVLKNVHDEIDTVGAVILSDYGKGLLTRNVCQEVIKIAKLHQKPIFVDPKSRDFSMYRGATMICPNLQELANASSIDVKTDLCIVESAQKIIADFEIESVLVTRSKDGMTLINKNNEVFHIPALAREISDVSGAGDTVVATLSLAVASGMSIEDSVKLANTAAGIVVGKLGTATITVQDLDAELVCSGRTHGTHKILVLKDAKSRVEQWGREGKKVGFTNGCFDLIHSGHLEILNGAKSYCDRLVVGVNSDASVKRLKGETRPINTEVERAMLLASLSVVDMVIIFGEDTPIKLIEALKPHILAKGADYEKHQVVGHEIVESYGGTIELIPLKQGYSTTNIIKKIA